MARLWSLSIAFAALICTTTACSDAPTSQSPAAKLSEKDGANFTLDRDVYTASRVEDGYARYQFRLVANFTNTTDEPVYLGRCYPDSPTPTYGVRFLGQAVDSWGSAYDAAWACVGHDRQIEVLPGATRTDTFEIIGPNAFDGVSGRGFGVLAGRMRLEYRVQSCRGDGACALTTTLGHSTPFEVRIAQ